MKAIIMAGGEGRRLRPITCTKPKPMVRLLDKPVIEYSIDLLKKHHIKDIAITTHYLPDEITDYLGTGEDFGVNITYFTEKIPLGTAGSIKNAKSFLDSDFVVISGDALTDIDITDAIDFHKKNSADATIVLKKVSSPLEYGLVMTDKSGRVTRFIEKPSWSEVVSDMANTGIYIFKKEILSEIEDGIYDFSYDLFPKLLHSKKNVCGYLAEGYWCDIGDTFSYMSCQHDMLASKTNLTFKSKQISDGIFIGKNVSIEPNAELKAPVYIGDNVHIGKNAVIGEYSVIESGAKIADFANIKKSIVGTNAHIGAFAQLRACIIGEKSVLKPYVSVYEQSVIGDDCFVGESSTIKPSIKLWPNKIVEPHTQVHTNLVWKNTHRKNLFQAGKIKGEIGVEMTAETASSIGTALGTLYKKGRIVVSCSGDAACDMLANAFMSGLMSAGCEVYFCASQTCAITRLAVKFYNLDGGVHISTQKHTDIYEGRITIMDENGCDIDIKSQRRLETLYDQGDFISAEGCNIQKIINIGNYKQLYIRDLMLNADTAKGKILINTQNKFAKEILESLLVKIGSDIEIYEGETDSKEGIRDFANTVSEKNFSLGAIIDVDGEHLILVDENGQVLSKNDMLTIDITISIEEKTRANIILPISAPGSLSELIKENGRNVVYTKLTKSDFMKKIIQSGSPDQFVMHFDALGALLKLLSYLSKNNITLSHFTQHCKKYYMTDQKIDFKDEHKGTLMRELASQYNDKDTDMTDGLKISSDEGWVLVMPDTSSYINIISEGCSAEFAEEIVSDIIKKIEKIRKDIENKN